MIVRCECLGFFAGVCTMGQRTWVRIPQLSLKTKEAQGSMTGRFTHWSWIRIPQLPVKPKEAQGSLCNTVRNSGKKYAYTMSIKNLNIPPFTPPPPPYCISRSSVSHNLYLICWLASKRAMKSLWSI